MTPQSEAEHLEHHASNAHAWDKLCDELLRQNRELQVINLRLLIANEKLLDQVKELQQWQAVSRALDVLPNFNQAH